MVIRNPLFIAVMITAFAPRLATAGPGDMDDLIVVDQPPLNTGGAASDTEFENIFGQSVSQRVADDFVLSSTAPISHVTWWGYYELDNPPANETFRLRFYEARPGDGLPDEDNIVFEQILDTPNRTATGRRIFAGEDPREFQYLAELSSQVLLNEQTTYWLEILQIGDLSTSFSWEVSLASGNSNFAFNNVNAPNWATTSINANVAFQLSVVPEPRASVLVILIVGIATLRRKRGGHMRLRNAMITCVLVMTISPPIALAGPGDLDDLIVFDRQPSRVGGGASDTLFRDMFGQSVFQRVADDVRFDSAVALGQLRWWGFYDQDNPPAQETFRIRFYGARSGDGLPDESQIVFEQTVDTPDRSATGETVFVGVDPDEYVYKVDFTSPITLAADAPYWLEIIQIGDIDTFFRWEFSGGAAPISLAVNNSASNGWFESVLDADNAFQLIAVPEPAASSLLMAIIGLAAFRRRRS
ncbi:MAG TPA: PEP-CTERM sorting domain-containing protein [Phycisphaerae bacterium]|nr:PEP-CTERM sorting domain-containing protein [Phycisphaerae bacterium]HRW53757.1 PEP-CTERM sorting domain-containing protein [Phycisphaerae bacterium]